VLPLLGSMELITWAFTIAGLKEQRAKAVIIIARLFIARLYVKPKYFPFIPNPLN
jgi:hypothetical protein